MIEYRKGNIFESGAYALVNPVNCVGIMGKGLALQFKNQFPENFKLYKQLCDEGGLQPGKLLLVEESDHLIINFPTKRHWKDKSLIEDIDTGLKVLAQQIIKKKIQSIAIPALGCGLGGLEWDQIKTLLNLYLHNIEDIQIIIYEP